MARWQTIYCERRKMLVGFVARKRTRKAACQRTGDVVDQSRRRDSRLRLRSHLPSETASAVILGAARFRFKSDLPLPRLTCGNEAAPDWHRPFQICGIQAQPVHQSRAQPGLLEIRKTVSRW